MTDNGKAPRNMRNPTEGMKRHGFTKDRYSFKKGFPTRANCDLTDPREMFLWILVAQPGVNGAQLTMPISYNMSVSEHIWECGAMLQCPSCGYAREPEKKWLPPKSTDPHWLTSPGTWVDPKTPEPVQHPADKALAGCTDQQKAELFTRLKAMKDRGEF
jgi:hypothetical protein